MAAFQWSPGGTVLPPHAEIARAVFKRAAEHHGGDRGQMPMPIIYKDKRDDPAVYAAYTNRHGLTVLFLVPAHAKQQDPDARCRLWAGMLAGTNRDFQVPVLVESVETARDVAMRLRASGAAGVQNLMYQTGVFGRRYALAPLLPPVAARVQAMKAGL